MEDEILTIEEVAKFIHRSVSWTYENASKLGVSRIAGSLIFTRSGLIEALENARQNEANAIKDKPAPEKKKRKKAGEPTYSTDPASHGLHNILNLLSSPQDEDVFAGLDIEAVLVALTT